MAQNNLPIVNNNTGVQEFPVSSAEYWIVYFNKTICQNHNRSCDFSNQMSFDSMLQIKCCLMQV